MAAAFRCLAYFIQCNVFQVRPHCRTCHDSLLSRDKVILRRVCPRVTPSLHIHASTALGSFSILAAEGDAALEQGADTSAAGSFVATPRSDSLDSSLVWFWYQSSAGLVE